MMLIIYLCIIYTIIGFLSACTWLFTIRNNYEGIDTMHFDFILAFIFWPFLILFLPIAIFNRVAKFAIKYAAKNITPRNNESIKDFTDRYIQLNGSSDNTRERAVEIYEKWDKR